METNIGQLKEILIHRLVDQGMGPNMIPGFIRSLANTFTYHPHMNLQLANDRMQQMGWGDFELNYFTYRLALECLEACGLNKSEYKSAQWFENNFTLNSDSTTTKNQVQDSTSAALPFSTLPRNSLNEVHSILETLFVIS